MGFEARYLSFTGHAAKAKRIASRVYTRLAELTAEIATTAEPVPFADRLSLDYRPIRRGESWGKAFTCAWIHVTGECPPKPAEGELEAILDFGGEGLLVDGEGRAVAGLTGVQCTGDPIQPLPGKKAVPLEPGRRIDFWIDAGFNGNFNFIPPTGRSRYVGSWAAECRNDIKGLYYDWVTAGLAAAATDNRARRTELAGALDEAWSLLGDFAPARVEAARGRLAKVLLGSETAAADRLSFATIGHSHLDLAWLWPVRETRRKAARTFAIALDNLRRDGEYVYGASQPQQFEWIRGERPELWEGIKKAVEGGRFELQGGMWVEPDVNVPSGESLVRQALYGKRFFRAEFGKDMRACWLPDVFGYNANLPQILRKTGMEYFMTIKLSWNETNTFPYRSFRWAGIDGSEVLVHMGPEGEYNSAGTPLSVKRAVERYPERDMAGEGLLIVGNGDGGGGPGEVHLELTRRQKAMPGTPRLGFGAAIDFFDRLKARAAKLPSWTGELYLEKHQGTYTTQGRNKRANREMERLFRETEALAALNAARGGPWPKNLFDRLWKETLLYQFHDILPGSSIGRVYEETGERYGAMKAELEAERGRQLAAIAAGATAGGEPAAGESGDEKPAAGDPARGEPGGTGTAPSWANLSPAPRSEYIKRGDLWFRWSAGPYEAARAEEATGPFPVKAGPDFLENEYLEARFSKAGHVVSLKDKRTGRETLASGGANRLVLFLDPPKVFNAWDIASYYRRLPRVTLRARKVEFFTDGPRAVRRTTYHHGKTVIVQDAVLSAGTPWLEFRTEADWHETFRMLRSETTPRDWADEVTCDIQFGSFRRSTRNDTSVEKAQYEICAHKWVDVSGPDGGFALLNDCKYGHRVKEGNISLNLLRSPLYPDPTADRGRHGFRYALFPHGGDAFAGGVVDEGWRFNGAPVEVPSGATWEPIGSVDMDNVRIETIKKAEDSERIVFRLVESHGKACMASLRTGFPAAGAEETDMLEENGKAVDLGTLSFSPFETKTVAVRVRK